MSIKKLLEQASTKLKAVKLSGIADRHRLSNYSEQMESTPFARTAIDFVSAAYYGDVQQPHEAKVDVARQSLREFFESHESMVLEFEGDGAKLIDLTKRWVMENHTPSDFVALAREERVPLDAAVMSFVIAQAKDMPSGHQSYVMNEMAVRVLNTKMADSEPLVVASFSNAIAAMPKNLQYMPFAVKDIVELSNEISKSWPNGLRSEFSKDHDQLQQDLRGALTSLACCGSEKIALAVAQSSDPAVQKSVLTFAERVGTFDPQLRSRIEQEVSQGNSGREVQKQSTVEFGR